MPRTVETLGPDRPHTIYRFTDRIYKVVQFYDVRMPGIRAAPEHHETKMDQSLSRARRVVLEKALCNPWSWFCTFTIAPDKADRKDLAAFWGKFSQFLRDQRKKYPGLVYLLVPEKHKDGAWHCHGLLEGLPEDALQSFSDLDASGYRTPKGRRLPRNLRDSEYYNWPAYMKTFGFCTLGKIVCKEATAFYVTKYITKETSALVSAVGLHTYYVSQNLLSAEKHVDFFGRDPALERLLVNEYEFCRTGMSHLRDGLDWTFMLDRVSFDQLEQINFQDPKDTDVQSVQMLDEIDQLRLF